MDESKPKTKRIVAKNVFLIDENSKLPIKNTDKLEKFEIGLYFTDEKDSVSKYNLIQHNKNEVKPAFLTLINLFIENGFIKKSEIQSKLLKGKAGRKPITSDESGMIKGKMKPLNKQVIELWNGGKEVPEIATSLRPKLKNKRRQNFIFKIRRILRENKRLLTREYDGKLISRQTEN